MKLSNITLIIQGRARGALKKITDSSSRDCIKGA